jgi:phosphohistidine swiveling domain-containing protein
LSRFLHRPDAKADPLVQSIALGLALQAAMLRLGGNGQDIAQWLADPPSAPAGKKAVIAQVQDIQRRRTALSPAWTALFSTRHDDDLGIVLPDYFWDTPPETTAKSTHQHATKKDSAGPWQGTPVCPGTVTGLAVIAKDGRDAEKLAALKQQYNAKLMLVFRYARPDTVEVFEQADAVLFCEGGVLSHACTVARDMALPAVTALGTGFFEAVKDAETLWLTVDGQAGTVAVLSGSGS